MPPILLLDDFSITDLQVRWEPPAEEGFKQGESEVSINYEVGRNREEPHRFRLILRIDTKPSDSENAKGYYIKATIYGFFSFPEGITEEEMQAYIRVTGGAILYSTFRGVLLTVSGSFPGGKILLPTVSMKEIVEEVEAKKASLLKKKPASKKKKAAGKTAIV